MTKTLLSVALLVVSYSSAQAQILSPQVISSTGAYATAGSYRVSYTVGEMAAIVTDSAGSIILTQGFQQPNDIPSGLEEIEANGIGFLYLFPVPAADDLWYGYEFESRGHIDVSLYDMTGRKLAYTMSEDYATGQVQHKLDCSVYASGEFLLVARFTSESGFVKDLTKKFQIIH